MDTDKAYLLGLIIGGGVFGDAEDSFRIQLPFKKWGSYREHPQRAGSIAQDILKKVSQIFRAIYSINIQYEASESYWSILCEGDLSPIKEDLESYGISCTGEIKTSASIRHLVDDLVDDNLKRRFIAGLADTIGSMAPSHRRFTDEHQVLSFEIKGYNYRFVCDLCRLLYSINCIPDQVNWNHPNIHCSKDSYYGAWHKGFKLRVLLDQYAKFGAFAFRTKAESMQENRKLQKRTHESETCEERNFHITPSCVHPCENDIRLPENIRGGHYIHFKHFCAVMECEHAPYCELDAHFKRIGEMINPFPILHKGNIVEIEKIIKSDDLLFSRKYRIEHIKVSTLLNLHDQSKNTLFFGHDKTCGYPSKEVMQAVAFVIAEDGDVKGKRIKGNYEKLLRNHVLHNPDTMVVLRIPDILTPLIITGDSKAALVGAHNPHVYKKLVSSCPENPYKLLVRKITEKDFRS